MNIHLPSPKCAQEHNPVSQPAGKGQTQPTTVHRPVRRPGGKNNIPVVVPGYDAEQCAKQYEVEVEEYHLCHQGRTGESVLPLAIVDMEFDETLDTRTRLADYQCLLYYLRSQGQYVGSTTLKFHHPDGSVTEVDNVYGYYYPQKEHPNDVAP